MKLFKNNGKWNIPLIVLYVAINSIVFYNATFHDPNIGYDAGGHLEYIEILSSGHLPNPGQTGEFFSPPLPYIVPALSRAAGLPKMMAARTGLFFQFILSLLLTFYLLRICEQFSKGSSELKLGTLLLLGMLPVYYKSFAFIRGEPYIACFAIIAFYYLILIIRYNQINVKAILLFCFFSAAAGLSRQWTFLIFPAFGLIILAKVILQKSRRKSLLTILTLWMVVTIAGSGWFYLRTIQKHGKGFNRQAKASFSFKNQPASFYFGAASGGGLLKTP